MVTYLELFKDWKFTYKFISFLIIALLILFGFIWGCFIDYWYISINNANVSYPRMYNLNVIISFWSVQTNFIIMLWFFFAVIYHNREQSNKFTNLTSQINITIYISITFLLFWAIIVGNILKISEYDFTTRTISDVVITSLTHSLTPLLMIIYYFLSCGKKIIKYKSNLLKHTLLMLIYPIIYCIFILIRAKIVYDDGIRNFIFPYNFVNFYYPLFGNNLLISNFVCISSLLVLLLTFNLSYLYINNWKHNKFNILV